MNLSTGVAQIFAAVSLSIASVAAIAAPVVIDFNDLDPNVIPYAGNFVSQGVSFSPNCHQHIANIQAFSSPSPPFFGHMPSPSGQWLGFDPSGCDWLHNDDYLGPTDIGLEGKMFISLANQGTFSLDKFDFIRLDGGPTSLLVQSSRGGYAMPSGMIPGAQIHFAGESWRDLEWILISQWYTALYAGIDNLTIRETQRVPEPGSSAAWIALIAALFMFRRKATFTNP